MMYILLIFFILAASSSASQSGRIVNGENAEPGQFPYVVSLRYKGEHVCAGSIMDETHVLTSAECFYKHINDPLGFTIQYAVTDITSTLNIIQVIKMKVYNMYDPNFKYQYDIGVLTLISPMTFNKFAQPVKFPQSGDKWEIAKKAIFVGWGARYSNETVSENLKFIELTTFDDESCGYVYPSNSNRFSNACAGDVERKRGICAGDMGGPLVLDGVQIGIAIYSKEECTGYPPLFTRVSYFVNWMWSSGMCT